MLKIKQAIVVEGKYDIIKLSSIVDAYIIKTDGFRIFKDKQRLAFIRKIAEKRGIIVLTDSDAAGFQIRAFIGGSLPPGRVTHAYIPDISGKERRKPKPSGEGKLGVEGVSPEVLIEALNRAGAVYDRQPEEERVQKADLYEDGLTGGKNSRLLRKRLLTRLALPEHLSANAMLDAINLMMDRQEYKRHVEQIFSDTVRETMI